MNTTKVPREALAVVHDLRTKALSLRKLPVPFPRAPDEHLVQVQAVAITNGELSWPEQIHIKDPIPGYEFSGTVITSPAKSPFPPGTEVYARTSFNRPGSARQYSIATTEELARKPHNLSWEESATVPLSSLTAWQALFVHGGLAIPSSTSPPSTGIRRDAMRVLVTAGAGGVGVWAIQLASIAGAYVVATCGRNNVEFVKDLGANLALDYSTTNINQWIGEDEERRKFDLVLDCVGGEVLQEAWKCVRDGGKLVSIVSDPEKSRPSQGVGENISCLYFIVDANHEQLLEITKLIELGKCKSVVDSVFPMQEYEEAIKKTYAGHARGKVVLKIV